MSPGDRAADGPARVLVVGGGTVGLTTALFLARQGAPVRLVERREAPAVHPRAMGIGPRTVELLREAGLADEVDARCVEMAGRALRPFSTPTLAEADPDRLEQAPRPQSSQADRAVAQTLRGTCPQNRLDEVLVAAAREAGAVVDFGVEALAVDQDDDGVSVRLSGDAAPVRADYVVAADGGRSAVRDALGVGVAGPGRIGLPVMSVLFRADLHALTKGWTFIVCDITHPDAAGGLLPVDGEREWIYHFHYDPDDGATPEDFTDQRCRERIRVALGAPDVDVEVVSVLPWQVRGSVADRFVDGRIVLAGDAAHVVPPMGAFGMNTGMADGHNLAWKLAAVLRGAASPRLLRTYEDERRPVAAMTLEQATLRLADPSLHWGRGPEAAARRAEVGALDAPVVHLGYRYRSDAVIGPVAEPPSGEDLDADLDGTPGSRLPHRWLCRDGRSLSTMDLVAGRFALLTGPEGHAWPAAAAAVAAELDLPLAAVGVGTDVEDPEHAWPASVGITLSGALLVRPDGIVAWREATAPPEPVRALRSAIQRVLCRV